MAAAPSIGRATGVEAPAAAPGSLAVQTLYERHADRVLAYCTYHLRDRNEAEDALQTTFMHALRALQRGVVPEIELAWLLSIARNVCLTRWNTNRRRGQLEVARDPHVLQEVAPCREQRGRGALPAPGGARSNAGTGAKGNPPPRMARHVLPGDRRRAWAQPVRGRDAHLPGPQSARERSARGPGAEQAPRCPRPQSQLAARGAQVASRWSGRQGRGEARPSSQRQCPWAHSS